MEYRRKCTVCGKIYCYTDSDVFDNNADKVTAALSGIATVAQLFGGTMLGAYAMSSQRDRYDQRVKDFTRCPYCNSQSTITLTHEQWLKEEQKGGSAAQLPQSTRPHVEINANATTESLLKRVHLFLEDSEWETADAYCDKILDVEPENSMAYLGKLMAETHSKNLDGLSLYDKNFEESGNFKKAVRFAAPELKAELNELVKQRDYSRAMRAMVTAKSVADYNSAALKFRFVSGYLDSDARAKECSNKAKEIENTTLYSQAKSLQSHASIFDVKEAKQIFETLGEWKDSKEQIIACQAKIEELTRKETEAKELAEKKKKTITVVAASVAALVVIAIATFFVITKVIIPGNQYKQAEALFVSRDYEGAATIFESLGNYHDSNNRLIDIRCIQATNALKDEQYTLAISILEPFIGNDEAVNNIYNSACYNYSRQMLSINNYEEALKYIQKCDSYLDSSDLSKVLEGIKNYNDKSYDNALESFEKVSASFKNENLEWFNEWYANIIYKYVMNSSHIGGSTALQYFSKVDASNHPEIQSTINELQMFSKCKGNYECQSSYSSSRKYSFKIQDYYLKNGALMADVLYDEFVGKFEPGSVTWNSNPYSEYPFTIKTKVKNDLTTASFTFQVSPESVKSKNENVGTTLVFTRK